MSGRRAVARRAVARRPMPARNHPARDTPRAATVAPDPAGELPHGLAASFCFESGQARQPYAARVRVTGRRADAAGPLGPRDHFVVEEIVDPVIPGTGPVSVTARVEGVSPGEWTVVAELVTPHPDLSWQRRRAKPRPPVRQSLSPAGWTWHRWQVSAAASRPMKARLAPLTEFARIPAVIPGSWAVLVALGVVIGFVFQGILLARTSIDVGELRAVSVGVVAAGVLGGKVWYVAQHLREWRRSIRIGWCIQGALVGATMVGIVALALRHIPIGTPLDMTAPGLFVGVGVGRLGCFFSGCCAGRPTASRCGLWSSDRRVGTRRFPTQLMESFVALLIGFAAFLVVLYDQAVVGTGALFVSTFAAYTLCRQLILSLRSEKRHTTFGLPATAAVAGAALLGGIAVLVLHSH